MRNVNRYASILLVLLFIMATTYAVIQLVNLPDDILAAIEITENSKLEVARNKASKVYLVLGFDFVLVLVIIFVLSTGNISNRADNVVYVERPKSEDRRKYADDLDEDDVLEKKITGFVEGFNKTSGGLQEKCQWAINQLCKELEASAGAFYIAKEDGPLHYIEFVAGYAFILPESKKLRYEFGEGIAGQAAKSGKEFFIDNVPENYIKVFSGLGTSSPRFLAVLPLMKGNSAAGLVEIAFFHSLKKAQIRFLQRAAVLLAGKVLQLQGV